MSTRFFTLLFLLLFATATHAQRFVKSVDTIQDMKNLNTADVHTTVEVKGYSAANDGGGGTFAWIASETTATNRGTVFKGKTTGSESSDGRWMRLLKGDVTAEMFGAKGDGVTDDTQAFQDSIAALNTVSLSGGKLETHKKQYLISDEILIANNEATGFNRIEIFGNGTFLQTAWDKPVFNVSNSWVRIAGLRLRHSVSTNLADAVRIYNSAHGVIEGLGISEFKGAAIRFMGSANHTWKIRDNFTSGASHGILIDPSTQLLQSQVYGNEFASTDKTLNCVGFEGTSLVGVQSFGNTYETLRRGIYLKGGSSCWNFVSRNDYFEAIDYYPIDLCASGQITGLEISGAYFNVAGGTGATGEAIKATGTEGAHRILNLFVGGNLMSPDTANMMNLTNLAPNFAGGCIVLGAADSKTLDAQMPVGYTGIRFMDQDEIVSPEIFSGGLTVATGGLNVTGSLNVNSGVIIVDSVGRFLKDVINGANSVAVRATTGYNLVFQANGATVGATFDGSGPRWNFGPSAPIAGASLSIESISGAFVPPRMTQTQRNNINGGSPVDGSMLYQTDNTPGLRFRDNGAWVKYLTGTDIDTSAELISLFTDESGTGALLFAGGNIGAATGISLNLSGDLDADEITATGTTITTVNASTLNATTANLVDTTVSGTFTKTATNGVPSAMHLFSTNGTFSMTIQANKDIATNLVFIPPTQAGSGVLKSFTDGDGNHQLTFAQIAGTTVAHPATLATDDTYQGEAITGMNNSGGTTQWDALYLNGSSQWVLADANGASTYPALGIASATVSTGNATTAITSGVIRNDAWTWTPGGTIYLSVTAGGLTQTAPSTSGDKVQVMGFALNADTMFVKISTDYATVP